MSEQTALLAAIAANPEEDTPRLIYADWLDEYKPARCAQAEFIRVQCELARRGLQSMSSTDCNPSHRCTLCNALWRLLPPDSVFPEGSWTLQSSHQKCGSCCDNVAMGSQIAELTADESSLLRRESELLDSHPGWQPACLVCEGRSWNWFPDPAGGSALKDECRACSGSGRCPCEFRRGLLWSVTVPTLDAVMWEAPCPERRPPNADVGPRFDQHRPHQYCPTCKGSQRVWQLTPWSAALYRDYLTVQRVRVTDREPDKDASSIRQGIDSFDWGDGEQLGTSGSWALPGIVFREMVSAMTEGCLPGWAFAEFPTQPAAIDALAAAVCRLGRGMAAS